MAVAVIQLRKNAIDNLVHPDLVCVAGRQYEMPGSEVGPVNRVCA